MIPCYNYGMNNQNQNTAAPDRGLTRPDRSDREETRSPQALETSPIASDPEASEHLLADSSQHDQISLPNEGARPDATHRDEARPDASEREQSRSSAPEREHDIEQTLDSNPDKEPVQEPEPIEAPIANWVDVEQASVLLRDKGVSRTIRTIQKMCKRGDFEANLVPTETGVRYIINEESIDEFVNRHNQKLPADSFGVGDTAQDNDFDTNPASDASFRRVDEAQSNSTLTTDADGEHLREIIDLKDQHISMLQSQLGTANNQIAVKDEQFAAMIERDHETNILIQNLQRMVGLPEVKPQPETRHQSVDLDYKPTSSFNPPAEATDRTG